MAQPRERVNLFSCLYALSRLSREPYARPHISTPFPSPSTVINSSLTFVCPLGVRVEGEVVAHVLARIRPRTTPFLWLLYVMSDVLMSPFRWSFAQMYPLVFHFVVPISA